MRTGPNSQQLSRDEVQDFFKKEGRIFYAELIDSKFSIESDINESHFFVHELFYLNYSAQ